MWVRGIDVSHYQSPASITDRAIAGDQFVFIKASEALFEDKVSYAHWTAARNKQVAAGPYHFFRSSKDELKQADTFLQAAGYRGMTWDLPYVLDYEHESGPTHPDRLLRFLERVEAETGKTPVIYTGYYAWGEFMPSAPAEFARFPLWIASYPASLKDGTPPSEAQARKVKVPAPWSEFTVWQYSDTNGKLDRNVCTPAAFARLRGAPQEEGEGFLAALSEDEQKDAYRILKQLEKDYLKKGEGIRQVILETDKRTEDIASGKRPVKKAAG